MELISVTYYLYEEVILFLVSDIDKTLCMFWVNKHTACRGENTKPALIKQNKKENLGSFFF